MVLSRRLLYRYRNDFAYILFILLLVSIWHQVIRFYENLTYDYIDDNKHILIWTPIKSPFFHEIKFARTKTMEDIVQDCEYTNCEFTMNKHALRMIDFDAIIFGAHESDLNTLPWVRSPEQKYILVSLESPKDFIPTGVENPIYFFNNFFNWTMSYRLDSDILWRYFRIYDTDGNDVGPRVNMRWLKEYKPLNQEAKAKLKSKSKAVVWMPSDCKTLGQKEHYVENLKIALEKYNLTLNGKCGEKTCANKIECAEMIKRDYYFYLAFENSFDADLVTEKLLNAIQNAAVPVVLGGANYSRFLPPGSYLDARKLNPKQMAKTIRDIILNFTSYQEYFRWTNHYKYKDALKPELCNICKALNDEKMVKNVTVYPDIKKWLLGDSVV